VVTGNTKFDVADAAKAARRQGERLRDELGLAEGALLIVAGSTRPGEEELLLRVYQQLRSRNRGLKLLLAPRHLQRLSELQSLIEKTGLAHCRRSSGRAGADLILLDSLGELSSAYSFATLAWIGGSWGPYGGQNPLEASAQGCPVIFGPDMRHFSEPARLLLEAGAALQCPIELLAEFSGKLLGDQARRLAMAAAAAEALKKGAGASRKTADLAWKLALLARLKREESDWRNQSAFASLKVSEFGSSVHAPR
jgi:3-deoxy-D-manno-octulosonic-acid transferase